MSVTRYFLPFLSRSSNISLASLLAAALVLSAMSLPQPESDTARIRENNACAPLTRVVISEILFSFALRGVGFHRRALSAHGLRIYQEFGRLPRGVLAQQYLGVNALDEAAEGLDQEIVMRLRVTEAGAKLGQDLSILGSSHFQPTWSR